ncbi:hypothetical protein KUTeg_012602, partial [Tegillarca granosa]
MVDHLISKTPLDEIDPEGVEIRTPKRLIRRAYFAKGSNCIWHINSKGSPCIVRGDWGTKMDILTCLEQVHLIRRLKAGGDFDTRFWMELFHSMEEEGLNNRDFLDKNLVQFCFMALIQ